MSLRHEQDVQRAREERQRNDRCEVSKGGVEKDRIKDDGCAAGIFQSVCHGCLELFDAALGLFLCVFEFCRANY